MSSIAIPRRILVGGGQVKRLGGLLKELGLSNPLIVSDKALQENGIVEKVLDGLGGLKTKAHVVTDTDPEPTTDSLMPLLDALRGSGLGSTHKFDCIVAAGGGSVMDSAKAANVLAHRGGLMRDFKAPKVTNDSALPLVAIPTTAGTGSEVTKFTIVTDSETGEKMLCAGLAFLPEAAVVDYELSLTTPKRLTADSGIDALCHAMEAFVSRRRNPFSQAQAKASLSLFGPNASALRTAFAEPENHEARRDMMLASTLAGVAFSNASVTLIHAMSRPIGAAFHVPHGLSNALLAPTVTRWTLETCSELYVGVTQSLGLGDSAQVLPDALQSLCADLCVPTLQEVLERNGFGVDEFTRMIPTMVDQAIASGSHNNNPRDVLAEDMHKLYYQLLE